MNSIISTKLRHIYIISDKYRAMVDIIDRFLSVQNVMHVANTCAKIGFKPRCGVQRFMQEFISGPYGAGMFDIWDGTSASLFLYQMNEEFIKYLRRRIARTPARVAAVRKSPAMSVANALNPFGFATGHGATYDFGHRAQPMTVATRRDPQTPSEKLFARTEHDQVGLLHLMARDDEACDPHFDKSEQEAHPFVDEERINAARRMTDWHLADISAPPEDDAEPLPYHLLVLDSQMSVLNNGTPSVPLGMGSNIQRGEIVALTGRDRNTVQSMRGRVTLADERKLANDIFARDSKGFILTSRM